MNHYAINDFPDSPIIVIQIPKDEVEKIDIAQGHQPTETLESYYARQISKPDILINGGFFNTSTGQPVFNFVDERAAIAENDIPNYFEGIGTHLGTPDFSFFNLADYREEVIDFVSGYPTLVKNGYPCPITYAKEINYAARRTIFGYNDNNYYMVLVDGAGLRFEQIQPILITKLSLEYAINLDGGGSTRALLKGERITQKQWSRPVDNFIAIKLKVAAPAPTPVYRVQVGAFGVKSNADAMQKRIAALSDTIDAGYRNCYVRYISPYYKCQVGAFGVKANAEKVLEDLRSKGITAFITT